MDAQYIYSERERRPLPSDYAFLYQIRLEYR